MSKFAFFGCWVLDANAPTIIDEAASTAPRPTPGGGQRRATRGRYGAASLKLNLLRRLITGTFFVGALSACTLTFGASQDRHIPVEWTTFVAVAGQPELVPEQWLQEEEARIAHNIVLPDVVAKVVPFDFRKARWKAWLPWMPDVGQQYFEHLCDTEAGEWILKVAPPQRGIYNARPMTGYSTEEAQSRFDFEAPAFQRIRHNSPDNIDSGTYFIGEPFGPYDFVEEPRRNVAWQSEVRHPYIRLFGWQQDRRIDGLEGRPMQLEGIDAPSARYAFTWRGLKRVRDREHSVSGVELLVIDRLSGETLAVRRQFIYAPPYANRPNSNSWLQGRVCARLMYSSTGRDDVIRLPMLATPSYKKHVFHQRELVAPLPPGQAIR